MASDRPRAAIFDMDGTLCDVSSLRHHVDRSHPDFSGRRRFDLFHGESHLCPPHREAIALYERYRRDHRILVVTARSDVWAMHTLLWLEQHDVVHDQLYMRPDGDFRPDVEVKSDILDEIREAYDPVVAVDDNPAIIELWESEGITTHVIAGHRG
jgi:FMN phosphatase YigB (HAD superfamily)